MAVEAVEAIDPRQVATETHAGVNRAVSPATVRSGASGKRSKYHNTPTMVDGIRFDSKAEARRYGELRLAERAGEIAALKLQPSYLLEIGKLRICTYRADFQYIDRTTNRVIVEDVKGVRTREYQIKAKLMKALHGIEIREVRA